MTHWRKVPKDEFDSFVRERPWLVTDVKMFGEPPLLVYHDFQGCVNPKEPTAAEYWDTWAASIVLHDDGVREYQISTNQDGRL